MKTPRCIVVQFVVLCAALIPSGVPAQTKADSLQMMNDAIKTMFDTEGIEVKPSYTFQHRVRYNTLKTGWKGEKRETIDLLFTDGSGVIGMKTRVEEEGRSADLLMVFDHTERTSLTFMHTDTLDMCMRMRIPDPFKETAPRKVHYMKTKKKRKIAGKEAYQWTAETDMETIELWIAPNQGDLAPVWKAWGKMQGQRSVGDGDFEQGLLLAGSLKKKDGEKPYAEFEALEVKLNEPYTFSSEGYTVR
jgi:hypothetical protein